MFLNFKLVTGYIRVFSSVSKRAELFVINPPMNYNDLMLADATNHHPGVYLFLYEMISPRNELGNILSNLFLLKLKNHESNRKNGSNHWFNSDN